MVLLLSRHSSKCAVTDGLTAEGMPTSKKQSPRNRSVIFVHLQMTSPKLFIASLRKLFPRRLTNANVGFWSNMLETKSPPSSRPRPSLQ